VVTRTGDDADGPRSGRRPAPLDRPLRIGEQVLPQREQRQKVRGVRGIQYEERAVFRHEERRGKERVGEPAPRSNADGTRGRGFWRGSPAAGGSWQRRRPPGVSGGGVGDQRGSEGGTGVGQRYREALDPRARTRRGSFLSAASLAAGRGPPLVARGAAGKPLPPRPPRRAVPPGRGERGEPGCLERGGGRAWYLPASPEAQRSATRSTEIAGRPARTTGAGSPRGAKRTPRPTRRPGSKRRSPSVVKGLFVPEEDRLVAEDDSRSPFRSSPSGAAARRRPTASPSLLPRRAGRGRSTLSRRRPASRRPGTSAGRTPCSWSSAAACRCRSRSAPRGPDRRATLEGWRQTSRSAPAARHASPVVSSIGAPARRRRPGSFRRVGRLRAFHASPRWQRTGRRARHPQETGEAIRSMMEKVYSIP